MSERPHHRKPATFKLDDPGVVVIDADDKSRPARGTVHVTPEFDPALLPVPVEAPLAPPRRGFRWGAVFWSAVGGLILLGLGLGVTRLIEDLFARGEGLGFLGLAFALAAALALVVVVAREALGPSCRISSSWRTRIRNWRGPAPRCRAMPTTSSTAPI